MHTLKSFHFLLSDAWGNIDSGFEIILTHTVNGGRLDAVVQKSKYSIMLTDYEQFLCDSLIRCGYANWDNKFYEAGLDVLDGNLWHLTIDIDDVPVCCEGMNGYPYGFDILIDSLHTIGIPHCSMELPSKNEYRHYIKHSVSEALQRQIVLLMMKR